MKKIVTLCMILSLISFGAIAQAKLGHVDRQQILLELPERATAETQVQKLQKQLEAQLKLMAAEYDNKLAKLEQDAPELTETVKDSRVQELNDLERRIQEFQGKAQNDMQKKESELLEPMVKKVQDAVNAVAKANGFSYIMDSQLLIYTEGGQDIGPLVRKELGL